MELPILYEDADIVVINKPVGIMTHPDGHTTDETVSDWFAATYPESIDVGESLTLVSGTTISRPGIVHRLDRDTSGVLILAKTIDAHSFMKGEFQAHEVQKSYLAFVYGNFKEEDHGTISLPIGRSRKDFRMRSAQRGAKGMLRDAITHWKLIGKTQTHSLLEVQPVTGRTHQLRVHLKAVHHPIVCDPLYAPKHPCDLGFKRLGLHSYRITFTLQNGQEKTVSAPLPDDLASAAQKFGFIET